MIKETGGPAFPFEYHNRTERHQKSFATESMVSPNGSEQYRGMTLRDYFAAKAMQANANVLQQGTTVDGVKRIAEDSYLMADAMLKARQT